MLVEIGLGDGARFRQSRAHALAEPGLDTEAEERIGKDRDDDRRDDGEQAEHQHEAHVKLRAGETAPSLDPDLHQSPGDDGEERQNEDEVEEQQQRVEMRPRVEGRQAAECCPGRGGGQDGGAGQRDRKLAAETHPAGPQHDLAPDVHLLNESVVSPARGHLMPRPTSMSNSRIFLRSVLRLRPRSCAARSWLPRVAPSVS
jgi:hypothetical protein